MKAYTQLSKRGRARRLRALVSQALQQYELGVCDFKLLGVYTNALFRLRTVGGSSFVMRICQPGWRTATDLRSEIMWLQYLSCHTDIGVPEPQPARNGDLYVVAGASGVPVHRRCVVMSWIPGVTLAQRLTEENLHKLGDLFALLHEHSADFSPDDGFTQRKMDTVLARDEEDALFSPTCREAFTPRSRDVIERTKTRVDDAFARLYTQPSGLRVIHNDLWHGNVNVYRGHLYPLDFEDTIWGYPVQDIAMSLQDLMLDVERDAYEPLQAAFRQGYESRLEWPESYTSQIDTFRAGRMLWVANYVARFEREHLPTHIEWLAGEFERFLETGRILKP